MINRSLIAAAGNVGGVVTYWIDKISIPDTQTYIFIDEDAIDGAGDHYLRSLILEITPRTAEFEPIKKYIHMVNFPFWEE